MPVLAVPSGQVVGLGALMRGEGGRQPEGSRFMKASSGMQVMAA